MPKKRAVAPQPLRDVLTVEDLAARWRVDRKVVYETIQRGDLRAFRAGKRAWRIRKDELERYERATQPNRSR